MRNHFSVFIVLLLLCALVAGYTQLPANSSPASTPAITPSPAHSPAALSNLTLTATPTATPIATPAITPTPSPSTEATPSPADGTVHSTDTFIGYYAGMEVGDYTHVCIRTENGEERWFWISVDCHMNFEALPPGQKLQVTWINVDKYVDEAESAINMDMITEVIILD